MGFKSRLQTNNMYSGIDHSFLAFSSKKDLIERNGGGYIPLYLHSEDDESVKTEKLISAIQLAIKQNAPKKSIMNIDRVISASGLVAAIFG